MSGQVEIRPLRARDVWPVSRLFRSAFAGATRDTRYRALTRRKGAFVAACGAEVRGFYVAWWKAVEPVVWLDYLAVSPGARGNGVGKALLEHCLCRAADAGAAAVRLSVCADNAEAIQFYEGHGFARAGLFEGGSRLHLTKALAPAAPRAECPFGWRTLRGPVGALTVASYTALLALSDLVDRVAARRN